MLSPPPRKPGPELYKHVSRREATLALGCPFPHGWRAAGLGLARLPVPFQVAGKWVTSSQPGSLPPEPPHSSLAHSLRESAITPRPGSSVTAPRPQLRSRWYNGEQLPGVHDDGLTSAPSARHPQPRTAHTVQRGPLPLLRRRVAAQEWTQS